MKVTGLSWGGVRTERFSEMSSFLEKVMGLEIDHQDDALADFALPNGDRFEVFGPADTDNPHFTTGPVVGFGVSDLDGARQELEDAGIELIGPIREGAGLRWAHFRGPDGNVYEITQS